MNRLVIQPSALYENRTCVRLQSAINAGSGNIWFEIERKFGDAFVVPRIDSFALGLLPYAMENGIDMELKGSVSEKLYYMLSGEIQEILSAIQPRFKKIRVYASDLINAPTGGKGVITGFSAGVDSFCAYIQHTAANVPPSMRLTHLLFTNVGNHGKGAQGVALFEKRVAMNRPFADEQGMPFISVNSNLDEFLEHPFITTHPLRNSAAVLALAGLIGTYFYAGCYEYSHCSVKPHISIEIASPVLLPLFGTESVSIYTSGWCLNRIGKTRIVADFEPSQRYLNVCFREDHDGPNCSICMKCCRTLLTLEIMNVVEKFHRVFDLDAYRRVRTRFVFQMLRTLAFPDHTDILAFARSSGYRFPFLPSVSARVLNMIPRTVTRPIGKRLRALTG